MSEADRGFSEAVWFEVVSADAVWFEAISADAVWFEAVSADAVSPETDNFWSEVVFSKT